MKQEERVTTRNEDGQACVASEYSYCAIQWDMIEKLADYEDTNLSPIEVTALKAENDRLNKQLENAVVLPCKVGDTVYFNTYDYSEEGEEICKGIQPHKVEQIFVEFCADDYTELPLYAFNRDWFLTEAEARLAELGGKE